MSLRTIFKAQSIVLLLNAIGGLFVTVLFLTNAGWEDPSDDLITLGQFMGMTFLVLSIWSWRMPDVAGDALKSIGMLFAIGGLLWTIIIGFHIINEQVAGLTAYLNIIITSLFAVGFYVYSKD